MNAKRLSEIMRILRVAVNRGARLKGNSILEKELAAWYAEPPIVLPILEHTPIVKPPVYEEQEPFAR